METQKITTAKTEIEILIETKEMALADAIENAEFWRSLGDAEKFDNENSRAGLLKRQIAQLISTN